MTAAWVEDFQDIVDIPLLEEALDWKWSVNNLPYLPIEYLGELSGIKRGGNDANVGVELDKVVSRLVLISNAPGNVYIFILQIFSTLYIHILIID